MTRPEISPLDALTKAIKILGGLSSAQRLLDIQHYQTIQQWKQLPAHLAPTVERLTKERQPDDYVTCEELDPRGDWSYLRASETNLSAHDHPSRRANDTKASA